MLDQLNLKLTASIVRTWAIDAYQRKMREIKHTLACKMVTIKVDLCTQKKRHFIGINLQAMVDGNLRAISGPVNERQLLQ